MSSAPGIGFSFGAGSSLSVEPDAAEIRVAFAYDQQKTPLLVNIPTDQAEPVAAALPQTTAAATPLPPPPLGQPNDATSLTPISPLPVTGNALALLVFLKGRVSST